jgi:hypothetical protein
MLDLSLVLSEFLSRVKSLVIVCADETGASAAMIMPIWLPELGKIVVALGNYLNRVINNPPSEA